ncbi:TRAP transporter fused permease subunit [uncultured Cocleimonas sp.]|uniref:TRAP transporter permease n=1 Tax=uncultured Cocleimonas sp. TaxID=1051587 RepID=UPI002639E584|nr:TRAP transporter fused permease subunit [uncultured Cocleimonas sp.]
MLNKKEPLGSTEPLWVLLGALSVGFHIWLIFSGLIPSLVSRPLHMALALPWVFIFLAKTKSAQKWGGVFTVLGLAACFYIAFNHELLSDQYGSLEGQWQIWFAGFLIICVLEMARRAISWPLPTIAALALLYGLFGNHLPGEFGHPGLPIESFLGTMTVAEGGLWGSLTGVSVNIVAIFVIMGAVLNAGEAGQGFMNLATAAAGKLKGGAAKVSVLSSALFGSISGSASANVASTGAITLPAMEQLNYPKRLAGAVEAVASSGGQIMPPLMGAGAFVMVELTGTPYTQIMGAAILPAILYFFTVWIGINAYADRFDLQPLAKDQLPEKRTVFITASFFAVPFIILLGLMFIGGYTPQFAAAGAILSGFILLFLDANLSFDLKKTSQRLKNVCLNAGEQIAVIASIILCAGLIISVLGQTGLGIKITSLILSVGGEQIWPALLLTALACLILGMEVPTTAAYVICISVAGPALQKLGLEPLIAHLFVFWFALLSTITPPVCGAVFIAAGMIGENWLKVAFTAMALGVGLYIIPLGMIANPAIITLVTNPLMALLVFIKLALGLALVSYGLIAKPKMIIKIGLIVAGLFVVFI